MSDYCIDVQQVHKSYREPAGIHPVLIDVSLQVPRGAFLALMGSSGSGKTTLLNLVGGLDLPDSGRILLEGETLDTLSERRRSHLRLRRLGFVFQFFNLLPHLTVAENIALPLLLLGRSEAESAPAVRALAEEVGLPDKLARQVNQLSGGEMQRVALARALIHRPAVLLADEPTGNLDSHTGRSVLALLRESAARHGATVLMVTHDAEAAAVADRIVHMRDGRIVED